ncbi:MAG: ABC transporter ATP-binding protein [Dehalococcoidia bacterium]|nr:ABC transporter ATP-binding protein [Dehalococcoidia bacterium]
MTLEFDARITLGPFTYEAAFAASNEIVVLFGHSGAGKSVSLQAIAGLRRPRSGRIAVGGRVVFDSAAGIDLPPQERRVGYVVQDLALFPHLTVAQNIAFGMEPGHRRRERIAELLALLGLDGFEARRPATLSGGQQQRVALARALARDAHLLLLDEPFSALDESLRSGLRRELLRLRRELGLTIVFVTHDLREAHLLADRLAVFDNGRILQFDARETVFRRPVSRRVASLTGVANILRGTVVDATAGGVLVDVDGARLLCEGATAPRGATVDVAIRAERVNLRRGEGAGPNQFPVRIIEEFAFGSSHTLRLAPAGPGPELETELAARPYEVLGVAQRRDFIAELPPADLHVMPVAPGEAQYDSRPATTA